MVLCLRRRGHRAGRRPSGLRICGLPRSSGAVGEHCHLPAQLLILLLQRSHLGVLHPARINRGSGRVRV